MAVLFVAAPGRAQERPFEVSLDGGFTHLLENEDDLRPAVNRIEVAVGLGAVIN